METNRAPGRPFGAGGDGRAHFSWPPPEGDVGIVDLVRETATRPAGPPSEPGAPDQAENETVADQPERAADRHPARQFLAARRWLASRRWLPTRVPVAVERVVMVVLALVVVTLGLLLGRWTTSVNNPGQEIARDGPQASPTAAGAGAVAETGAEATTGLAASATLDVSTEPAGAWVSVDGRRKGVTPLTVGGLSPGRHEVVVGNAGGTVTHAVSVEAGQNTSLVVSLPARAGARPEPKPAPTHGTLVVRAPIEVRLLEDGRLIGTSAMEEVRLRGGSHRLTLRNETYGFEQARTVSISAGRTTTLDVELPSERVAVNASPWAEVWVAGQRVGETPMGSLRLPLGPHRIVLRHPDLGERSVDVLVRAGETARVGVEMRR